MKRLRELILRIGGLFNKQRKDREFDDEIESHLRMQIEDNVRLGMTPEEARREALMKLGGIESTKEAYRDQRRLRWIETFWQDLRFGARMLRKNPGFTGVAVVSLALGIGGNTAIFTLLDQVLLRLLPVRNPQELVQIQWRGERNALSIGDGTVSYPFYRDIRDRNQVFTGVISRFPLTLGVAHQGQTDRVEGELVSGNYFEVLGVPAALGRLFTPEDDRIPSGHPLAVLSYHYWTERFAADPKVLGQTILVNDFPLTVIGVSAKGFDGLELGVRSEIRIPVAMKKEMTGFFGQTWNLVNRRAAWLHMFARLAPGITRQTAQVSLTPLFQSILRDEGELPDFMATGPEQSQDDPRRQVMNPQLEVIPAARGPSGLR